MSDPHDKYAGKPPHEAAGWHPNDPENRFFTRRSQVDETDLVIQAVNDAVKQSILAERIKKLRDIVKDVNEILIEIDANKRLSISSMLHEISKNDPDLMDDLRRLVEEGLTVLEKGKKKTLFVGFAVPFDPWPK